MRLANGLRAVAILEATKGALVLLVGFGLLSLVHHDIEHIAEQLVRHAHMNPASHYPRIFIDAASQLADVRLWLIAAGAGTYATVRFIEAYGLWHGRRWAEWFAALSGSIYIPYELLALERHVSWISISTLTVNVAIVAYMVYVLYRTRRGESTDL